jgi:glycosyltransferase involved in cell wall biosynthesis
MRVAVVHDFLSQRGGAERVVLHMARVLRDPVIVTSLYAPEDTYPELAEFPVLSPRQVSGATGRRFRARVLSYPGTFRSFDLSGFDLVLISSSAFAHHVNHPRSAVFWHTPPRYLYDPGSYMPWVPRFPLTTAVNAATVALRRRDGQAAGSHRLHAANSRRTADRLRQAYGLDVPVLHPPLDIEGFPSSPGTFTGSPQALVVSRLLPYKRVDLAIAACRQVGIPLTVIGAGPDHGRLQRMAGPSVTFRSGLSDAELAQAYADHALVLCPGQEDFGYIPIEAAYSGRPVVAASGAGADETVLPGTSGLLVRGTDPTVWAGAIESALSRAWSPARLHDTASRFSADRFTTGLAQWLSPLADPSELFGPVPQEVSA